MKKLTHVVIAAMLLAICIPAFAQFPDVPSDHWAYAAIQDLVSKGLIVGYPDGTFGGKRALTRYEFAQAIAQAISKVLPAAGVQGPAGPAGPAGVAGPQGPAGASTDPAELANLQKLVGEFQSELADLGMSVDAVKKDLAALNSRVDALANEVARVKITGEANIVGIGYVDNSGYPYGSNGERITNDTPSHSNLLSNSEILNDFALGIQGRVSNDSFVKAVITYDGYSGIGSSEESYYTETEIWNLYYQSAVNLGPLGPGQLTVGRFPFQLTPLTLKSADPWNGYVSISRYDTGDYIFDGGKVDFKLLGHANVTAFAAKAQNYFSPELAQYGTTDTIGINQLAGLRAVIGTPFDGKLGLTYYQAALDSVGRAEIYGADLNATVAKVGVTAEYGKSKPNDTSISTYGIDDTKNSAWNANLNYGFGKLAIGGGYTEVEANYFAPGYWSQIGRAVNLTNVKGAVANVSYGLGSKITLTGNASFLKPKDNDLLVEATSDYDSSYSVSMLGSDLDKVTNWKAGIKYALSASNTINLGYEEVQWSPTTSGYDDVKERYITVGVGHSFNTNASLKLLYQIVDYTDTTPGTGGFDPYNNGNYRGGIATAQFQLKF